MCKHSAHHLLPDMCKHSAHHLLPDVCKHSAHHASTGHVQTLSTPSATGHVQTLSTPSSTGHVQTLSTPSSTGHVQTLSTPSSTGHAFKTLVDSAESRSRSCHATVYNRAMSQPPSVQPPGVQLTSSRRACWSCLCQCFVRLGHRNGLGPNEKHASSIFPRGLNNALWGGKSNLELVTFRSLTRRRHSPYHYCWILYKIFQYLKTLLTVT